MRKTDGFSAQLGLGVCLAIGLITSAWLVSTTLERLKSSDHTIQVKGYAEQRIVSDVALWSGTLIARSPSLTNAYCKLEKDKDRVLEFLTQEGIESKDIALSVVTKEVINKLTAEGKQTNDLEGFVVRQVFSLQSNEVHKVNQLATKIDQLNTQGIEFESRNPEYFYSSEKMDGLKIYLLGEATKSGRARAEQLAKNSNAQVGRLISASQGIFQVTPLHSTDLSDYGIYDTSSIEKSVKIVVTISYATS